MKKSKPNLELIARNHANDNADYMRSKELAAILAPLGFRDVVIDRTGNASTDSCERFVACDWRADRVDIVAFDSGRKWNGGLLFDMKNVTPLLFFNRPNFTNPYLLAWANAITTIIEGGVTRFTVRGDGATHDIPTGAVANRVAEFMHMISDTIRTYDDMTYENCYDACLADMKDLVAA